MFEKRITVEQFKGMGWKTWNGAGDFEKTKPDLWMSRIKDGKLWHMIYNTEKGTIKMQSQTPPDIVRELESVKIEYDDSLKPIVIKR